MNPADLTDEQRALLELAPLRPGPPPRSRRARRTRCGSLLLSLGATVAMLLATVPAVAAVPVAAVPAAAGPAAAAAATGPLATAALSGSSARQVVTVGAGRWWNVGTNVARTNDRLVVFRAPRVKTPGSRVTVDVTVVANRVVTVRDTRRSRVDRVTAVPKGGYVISGRGKAASWLFKNARRGARVTVPAPPASPKPAGAATAGTATAPRTAGSPRWLSGASGARVADGSFGSWRGTAVEIAGSWSDTREAQAHLWSVGPGGEFGTWTRPVDLAMGGIFAGDTWAEAAKGRYDARWRESLTKLKSVWGARPTSNLYLRFAHEFNGDWMPWKVTGAQVAHYKTAYRRWSRLADQILPGHHNVWSPNDGTAGSLRLDVRTAFPGGDVVDVIGVDSYNMWPACRTATACAQKATQNHSGGAPLGVETWRQYAASVGKPLALPEWGTAGVVDAADPGRGDAPAYITWMHGWLSRHGGHGAGRVLYEIYFNVESFSPDKRFVLYPTPGHNRSAAAAYQTLF